MTKITIFRNHDGEYLGFDCLGHAGYADEGEDIVCAGISVLVINTINSIEKLTDVIPKVSSDEETGMISCRIEKYKRKDIQLLLQSLSIGLLSIQETYGQEFIKVFFEEV